VLCTRHSVVVAPERMSKIVAALQQNADLVQHNSNGGGDIDELTNELEAKFAAFDAGCERLEAEPDITRRRALNDRLGVSHLVGKTERLHAQIMEARGNAPGDAMAQLVFERLILPNMIERAMTLCHIKLDPAEVDRIMKEREAAGHDL
jgi:hypothetical protein